MGCCAGACLGGGWGCLGVTVPRQISLAFPQNGHIQLLHGIYNASGFVAVVDTQLVSDQSWERSHRLLPLSRGLWALRIHVLGRALVHRSCERSSQPVSGFTSVLSYLYAQLRFRSVWLILAFVFNSPKQVCPLSSYLTGACLPDFGKHPVTQ